MKLMIALLLAALASASVHTQQPPPTIHQMNDGFAYQIVDFGLGTVPYPFGLSLAARRSSPPNTSVFWMTLKITNLSDRQLAIPKYSYMVGAIDDARNEYTLRHESITRPKADSGRYQPGESTLSLAMIPATELIEGIKELRVVLGDTGGFGRGVRFFSFRSPQSRQRDFDPTAPEPDPATVPVEARGAFLPFLTPR